ncbi:DUF1850 domain-containing protein [Roseovarius dicentrarchi]|uniref:DUF1850 domain-containing protein n=1 Tax=Roseovarius dicentrarchi TaxID=2250573 RepID=UPI000DEB7598|nr:DUF1850 domain-containing protein [Roseovarius dicentrarchi]
MPPRGIIIGVLGVAILAIPALPAAASPADFLCLSAHPGGAPLASYPLEPGASFALEFIHSVSRTPVMDSYRIDAGQIIQTSEVFLAHGAGLPSMSDELDATGWRHEDGKFILDLDRPIGEMIVRVQPAYNNTLHTPVQSIALASLGHSALRIAACNPSE